MKKNSNDNLENEIQQLLKNNKIESIVGKRIKRRRIEYLVKWEKLPESENKWILLKNLKNYEELIDNFEKNYIDNYSKKIPKIHKYTSLWKNNQKILKDCETTFLQRKIFLMKYRKLFLPFVNLSSPRVQKLGIFNLTPEQEKAVDELEIHIEDEPLDKQPEFVNNETGNLRDYQLFGINWLIRQHDYGIPSILGDEMGLGKTVQTIVLLAYLKIVRGETGPHLIIAPLSVLRGWISEIERWCPQLKTLLFHGNKKQRDILKEEKLLDGKFDICITNYESLLNETYAFSKFVWRYLIIDEGHCIKNEETNLSQVVRKIRCQQKLLLTGTPLQVNDLHELWSLLNFLFPDLFDDPKAFDECFNLEKNIIIKEKIMKLSEMLSPFMLRRLKKDVEISIPPKTEIKIYVPLTELQTQCYKSIISHNLEFIKKISNNDHTETNNFTQLLNLMMQLRKVCLHPYLFDIENESLEPGEHLINTSGKMVLLDKLLPKLKEAGSRVLLFSQFTRMMDILEDYLLYRGYHYLRLDGSTHTVERDFNIERFLNDQNIFIFMISTRAGGLGINLTSADSVILYDSDWNPHLDLQAQARCHRIGQTKHVKVYRLVSEGTMEERMIQRAERKMFLDAAVMNSGNKIQQEDSLSKGEVLSMLKFGANKIFSSKGQDITDEDINTIIERSEKKTKKEAEDIKNGSSYEKIQEDCEFDVDKFDINKEKIIPLRRFQGIDHKFDKKRSSIVDSWNNLGKRKRNHKKFLKKEIKTLTENIKIKKKKKPERDNKCFICRKTKNITHICSIRNCTKVYHEKCLQLNFENSIFFTKTTLGSWHCPWHKCHSCFQTSSNVGYLFRCENCPKAYCKNCLPNEIKIIGKMSLNQKYQGSGIMYIQCLECKKNDE